MKSAQICINACSFNKSEEWTGKESWSSKLWKHCKVAWSVVCFKCTWQLGQDNFVNLWRQQRHFSLHKLELLQHPTPPPPPPPHAHNRKKNVWSFIVCFCNYIYFSFLFAHESRHVYLLDLPKFFSFCHVLYVVQFLKVFFFFTFWKYYNSSCFSIVALVVIIKIVFTNIVIEVQCPRFTPFLGIDCWKFGIRVTILGHYFKYDPLLIWVRSKLVQWIWILYIYILKMNNG